MKNCVVQKLTGWGRYPVEDCCVLTPRDEKQLAEMLLSSAAKSYISRGLGRSYGDAALNDGAGVVSHLPLKRLLAFDPESGDVECEAGVSFAELIERFLPLGFFPPVVPGTKFVTVGGAIANDVHGKNHHRDGSFGDQVTGLKLLTARGQTIACSPRENAGVFFATLGGIGLTGAILSARFKLRRVESTAVTVDYHRTRDIDEALTLFSSAADERYQYSVAWIDCLATGRDLGRSVLMRGDHAVSAASSAPSLASRSARAQTRWSVPFDLPSAALNKWTIGAFNEVFYRAHPTRAGRAVALDKFFFPLDAIGNWNRMYGRRGFLQYQVVLPLETSRRGLVSLLEQLSGTGRASFLAVLKRFGPNGRGLLSFPRRGFTLALDLPFDDQLPDFLRRLDRTVLECGGRVYLAKDAVLRPEAFAEMYPGLRRFREMKRRLDPANLFSSSMSRRLGIN